MKLQYLAVIFVIIIMPIVMILSQYIDYNIDAITLRKTYDTKLLNSTYDAIKAYQLNTINNAISDISASKIEDLEAAVKTFFNSVQTSLGYTGYKSSDMKTYIPAVVLTMYDGYYIYSPYQNVLTGVPRIQTDDDGSPIDDDSDGNPDPYVDKEYINNSILHGIKPYVYYSCRYKKDLGSGKKFDVVITYTLDNYITVQGTVEGEYVNKSGYLISNISSDHPSSLSDDEWNKSEDDYEYTYDGISFKKDSTERLTEYLGDTEYYYVKLNGTKYYLKKDANEYNGEIFYINASGEKSVQVSSSNNSELYQKYYDFITENNSAYKYYRESYIFTKWVEENLGGLSTSNAMIGDGTETEEEEVKEKAKKIFGEQNIFKNCTTTNIQDSDSSFNAHRSAVIRYTIESNLSASIAAYKNYYNNDQNIEYKMPKISETDWETLENNVSIITFLQGFTVGGREYNKYCVVANNLNKEHVDENDIYILGKDKTYYKVNDSTLDDSKIKDNTGFVPGIWKINFEQKSYKEVIYSGSNEDNYKTKIYYPISYKGGSNVIPYIGSYSSIIASTSVDNSEQDLYKYMRAKESNGTTPKISERLRTVYYTALARERWGQYSVNKEIDIKPGDLTPDDIYEEQDQESPEIIIEARTPSNLEYNGEWTKENVTIIGTATDNVKIASYGFEPDIQNMVKEQLNGDKKVKATYTKTKTTSKTGDEYIFWANDTSGNSKESDKINIKIDKVAPTINISGNETEGWNNKNVPITVTLRDEHSRLAGYAITASEEKPSKYTKLNDQELKNLNLTISDDGQEGTIKSGSYIHIIDKVGNVASEKISANFDKTKPTVTVTPTSAQVCKSTQITIILSDPYDESGLESEEGICYLSKYNEEIDKTENEYYDFKSGETFTIGEGLTGVYELWIEDVSDRAGNINEKHSIGTFIFDNEAPEIELEEGMQENESDNSENKWHYKNEKKDTITDGIIEIPIGATVNYNPTSWADTESTKSTTVDAYLSDTNNEKLVSLEKNNNLQNLTWKIIGIDEQTGKIQLMSTKNIVDTSGNEVYLETKSNEYISGWKGHLYPKYILDNICSLYGNGFGADSARSIKVEDIVEKICKNDPTVFYKSKNSKYNEKSTWWLEGTSGQGLKYQIEGRGVSSMQAGVINYYINSEHKVDTLDSEGKNKYSFNWNCFSYDTSNVNIDKNLGIKDNNFWIGTISNCYGTDVGAGGRETPYSIGMFTFENNVLDYFGILGTTFEFLSTRDKKIGVRPIVELKSDITLIKSDEENTYNLKETKGQNIMITLSDSLSGLKSNDGTCYLSTSADENTKTKEYEFTSGKPFEIGKGLTGEYYIWVASVSDKVGNETGEVCIGGLEFDNKPPTVEVTPTSSELCQNIDITIKLKNEGGSGLKSEQGTYYWSLSQSSNDRCASGTYTSNKAFTAGANLTGTYYLWVGDVEDNAGNVNPEHCVGGPYVFDNTAPTVTFGITPSTSNTISVETTAIEIGEAGISSYKYYISNTKTGTGTLSKTNDSNSTNDSYIYSNLVIGNTYYVYVVVTDNVGNSTKSNVLEVKLVDNYMITKSGKTTQYKTTLADAVSVAKTFGSGSTITVMKSCQDDSDVIIQGLSNLTINLNGSTIKRRDVSITIDSSSSVNFVGSGNIICDMTIVSGKAGINNSGTLNINCNDGYGIESDTYCIKNVGTLTIKSGRLEGDTCIKNTGGTVNMDGGKVLSSSRGISISGSGILNMNEGEIQSTNMYSSASGIEVYYSGSITINNGLIYGDEAGIYFSGIEDSSDGTLTMNNGSIESNEIGIVLMNSRASVNILGGNVSGNKYGIKESGGSSYRDSILDITIGDVTKSYSKDAVTIIGGEYAIYRDTKLYQLHNIYFYNGRLETKTIDNEVLSGAYIQEVREGYSIIDEQDSSSHYKYLNYVSTNKMYAIEDKLYSNLQEAVTNAINGDTIVLLKSGTDSSNAEFTDKDITLLLNSYTLTKTTNSINIGSGANMTVTGKNATLRNQNIIGFTVTGQVKIYGNINMSTTLSSYPLFDTNGDGATININNGTLSANHSGARIVNIDNKATCYISDVAVIDLYNGAYGIYNSGNESKIYLNGGTINVNSSSYGLYNNSNIECVLSGITINVSNSYGIYNHSNSAGVVSAKSTGNGLRTKIYTNTTNSYGIYNKEGSTVSFINNSDIYMASKGTDISRNEQRVAIYNGGSGDININGGYIGALTHGIINDGSGNINVESGTIEGKANSSKSDWASIKNTSTGNININGGYITGYNVAIYNTNSNAQIIIGNQNEEINTTYPSIKNRNTSNYAIYTNSSSFYFYNGRIINYYSRLYNRNPILRYGYAIKRETQTDSEGKKYIEYLVEDPNIEKENQPPTVDVSIDPDNTEVCKNKKVKITLTDTGSGLQSNTGEYFLSRSSTTNDKAVKDTFYTGEQFTVGDKLTGTYYLWVGDIYDKLGNVCNEHYTEKMFNFDNTAPTIDNFSVTSTTTNSVTVKATATEIGQAGINTYEYYISNTENGTGTLAGEHNSASAENSYTYENLEIGKTYYMYAKVKDNLLNISEKSKVLSVTLTDNYKITKGSEIEYSSTLSGALEIASSGAEITLMNTIEDNSEGRIVDLQNLTINLNGNTLTRNIPVIIGSTSNVKLIGKGYISNISMNSVKVDDVSAIMNSGELTIECEENSGIKSIYIGVYLTGGNVTLNKGIIKSMVRGIMCAGNAQQNIVVNGGSIISNYDNDSIVTSAIYSEEAHPTINLLSGIVSGSDYGIQAFSYTEENVPTVIVGDKNSNEYKKDNIIVEGGQYAAYLDTSIVKGYDIYFYNSLLRTKTIDNEVLSGAYIQEVRQAYSVIDEKNSTSHDKYLSEIGTDKMYAIENKLYSTLGEAVAEANTGDTIVLLKDGTDSSKVEFNNKNITLLLNSYKLTKTTNTINIGSNAIMTVTGNNATLNTSNIIGFAVTGKLRFYGIINMSTNSSLYPIFDTAKDGAIIDINRGTFVADGAASKIINIDTEAEVYIRRLSTMTVQNNAYGVYNSGDKARIYLNSGTFNVTNGYGIYNDNNIHCILDGTEMNINDNSYALYNSSTSSGIISTVPTDVIVATVIKLNTINSRGIYNEQNSTVEIKCDSYIYIISTMDSQEFDTETDISGAGAIYNAGSGDINITQGQYSGLAYGIKNTGTGNINIQGEMIRISEATISTDGNADYAGIYNSGTGKITLNIYGQLDGSGVYGYNVGIYNTGNTTIDILGGRVATYNGKYGQGKYAIYNTNANAIINIGNQLVEVNQDNVIIKSENNKNWVIYTESLLYFYNGRIESSNGKFYNKQPQARDSYYIQEDSDKAYLIKK